MSPLSPTGPEWVVAANLHEPAAGEVGRMRLALVEAGVISPLPNEEPLPHFVLATNRRLDRVTIEHLVADFAKEQAPLGVQLASVGLFRGRPATLFLGPVVTVSLLEMHAQFHAHLQPLASPPGQYHWRNSWMPHCVLATGLSAEQVAKAMEVAAEFKLPLPVRIESLSLLEMPGAKVRVTYQLGVV